MNSRFGLKVKVFIRLENIMNQKILRALSLSLIFVLCLGLFSACTQSEPNKDKPVTEQAENSPAAEAPSSGNASEPAPTPLAPDLNAPPVESGVLKADYLGLGELTYSFKSFEKASELPGGVNFASDKADNFLLVEIEVENNSVKENDAPDNALINCFNLHGEKADGSDVFPSEPVYFSGNANSKNADAKSYFSYKLPAIGEKTSFIVGYELSDKAAEFLNSNKLFLHHTLSEVRIAIKAAELKK